MSVPTDVVKEFPYHGYFSSGRWGDLFKGVWYGKCFLKLFNVIFNIENIFSTYSSGESKQ